MVGQFESAWDFKVKFSAELNSQASIFFRSKSETHLSATIPPLPKMIIAGIFASHEGIRGALCSFLLLLNGSTMTERFETVYTVFEMRFSLSSEFENGTRGNAFFRVSDFDTRMYFETR